ncbi:MAG TPA: PKD domain-containing protein [Thermoplasmatales archaeon]|nr:PKD domain-containing protein [Thermoplasmatales archaeon]
MDWLTIRGGLMNMKKSTRNGIILPLSLIFLLSISLAVIPHGGAQLIGEAEMSVVPEKDAVYFGETFTVDIVINATDVITAQCWLTFDNTLLTAVSVENGDMFDNLMGNGTIDNASGTIDDIWGFSTTPVAGGTLATITFQAKNAVGVAAINLVVNKCLVPPYNITLHNATVEVRNLPVELAFTPDYASIGNETADFNLTVDPNGNAVTVIQCDISFDATSFEVTATDGGLFPIFTSSIDNVNGKVTIVASVDSPAGITDAGTLAVLTFNPIQSGMTYINISDRQVAGEGMYLYNTTDNAMLEADIMPPAVTFEFGMPYYNNGTADWISSATPIYINATDEHDYNIYYRIWNGSWSAWQKGLLNTDMLLYMQNEGMYYIEYYANDSFGNPTEIYNVTVYVDNTPPATTIDLTGPASENGWFINNVVVTFDAVDLPSAGVNYTMYRIDGGAWQLYTAPFMVDTEGIHTIEYYSVDNVGNEETTKSGECKIDKTAPVLSYGLSGTSGNAPWYTSTVTVNLSAIDGISGISEFKYRVNGVWQDYTQPFTLSDGIHTVQFYARNGAGLNASDEFNVSVDKTKPSSSHNLAGTLEDGKYTSDVTVTLSASDTGGSGLSSIKYRLDGVNWATYSAPFKVSAEGVHTLEYQATDNAGNTETKHQITFEILKNKKPTADFSYTPTSPTDLDTITFADQSDDEDGEVVAWAWDFGDNTTSTLQNPTHKYADNGTYVVKLTVTDDKGATATKQQIITVTNDPPTALFKFDPTKPKIREEVTFTSLSADEDGTIVNFTWDFGDGNISYEENPVHIFEKKGTYNVTLTVIDNDGATHQTMLQVKVTKEEVNTLLYVAIIVALIIIAIIVVVVWKQRTKSS